jgi:hypothetical protein
MRVELSKECYRKFGLVELRISQGVIPKSPRFYQRAEGSPMAHSVVAEALEESGDALFHDDDSIFRARGLGLHVE